MVRRVRIGWIRGKIAWYATGGVPWEERELDGPVEIVDRGSEVHAILGGERLIIFVGADEKRKRAAISRFVEALKSRRRVGTGPVTNGYEVRVGEIVIDESAVKSLLGGKRREVDASA